MAELTDLDALFEHLHRVRALWSQVAEHNEEPHGFRRTDGF